MIPKASLPAAESSVYQLPERKTEMPKHTPGRWSRNIKPAKKYNTIHAGRNTHICYLAVTGLTEEEIEANCDLIVAAPEMLEALDSVFRMLLGPEPKTLEDYARKCSFIDRTVRNAINRAEGSNL